MARLPLSALRPLMVTVGEGEDARVALMNSLTESRVDVLRSVILQHATAEERKIAEYAQNEGSGDFTILCIIAARVERRARASH